jgi:hypothetical protein
MSVQERNRELAKLLIAEARVDPESPYAGKFIGIANGQVVAVADDWDQLARLLRDAEPDPSKTLAVEVGRDYDAVQEIWRLSFRSSAKWALEGVRGSILLVLVAWFVITTVITVAPGRTLALCLQVSLIVPLIAIVLGAFGGVAGFIHGVSERRRALKSHTRA